MDIPQTIIYANTKLECAFIADKLRGFLPTDFHKTPEGPYQVGSDVRTEAERLIPTFYSTLDQTTKTIVHNDMLEGRARIMVASEAYGLGMDVDVVRVIQWGVGKIDSMDTLIQRFGRAGRDSNKQAMVVLYVEPSYFQQDSNSGDEEEPETQPVTAEPKKVPRTRRGAAAMQATKDPVLMQFIKETDGGCRRKIILAAYSDPLVDAPSAELASGRCCDVHEDDLDILDYPCARGWDSVATTIKLEQRAKSSFPSSSATIKAVLKPKLEEFRRRIFRRDWEPNDDDAGLFTEAIFLTDKHISFLVKNCTKYPTVEDLKSLRGFSWIHVDKYGPELCRFVQKVVGKLKAKEAEEKKKAAEAKKVAQQQQL
jgi:hypothetical protein